MKNLLLLAFTFLAQQAIGQILSPDNRIIVKAEASIEMPADQVSFIVQMSTTDSLSLDNVYEGQRKLEKSIYALLKELKIPAKNISYSMLSVGKSYNYDTKTEYFIGRQHVSFILDSIKMVPAIQEKLIREGFSEFGSNFTSTEIDQKKKELLEKAIMVAKEKANTLALASNRKIKRISKVADTDDSDYTFSNYQSDVYGVSAGADGDSLSEIPQTVSISVTLKVTFELK